MKMIKVERIFEQRDVDAALCLLRQMLGMGPSVLDADRRTKLEKMKISLEGSRRISGEQKNEIVRNYREVVG